MKWLRIKKDEFKVWRFIHSKRVTAYSEMLFQELRRLWTLLDQQISAQDEVEICKTRLRLKSPDDNGEVLRKPSKADKVLKNLSTILENKLETIHLLEEHEVS